MVTLLYFERNYTLHRIIMKISPGRIFIISL